jgi:AcrR family transcriptional regulator
MALGLEDTQTSRSRLLASGKSLFARLGYEQVSTAAIAREAGTSESQLVRYFGGKAGLLEAIFNESWKPLNDSLESVVADASNAYEAVTGLLSGMIGAFARDPDLGFLFLFEGRRMRGNDVILLSQGYLEFINLVQRLIRRGQRDGTFSTELNDAAAASALMGAAEGMMRDRLIAQRIGKPNPYSEKEISAIFTAMLQGLIKQRSEPASR